MKAIHFVEKKDVALDLGSGALKDSRYLLRQEFNDVYAVDVEDMPKEFLGRNVPQKHFHFIQSAFDAFEFPSASYDLVNASYSLPFNPPDSFPVVWDSIQQSLVTGGIFCGQFFGINDEWNVPGNTMTFQTAEEIMKLLKYMEIIECSEVEKDGKTANGISKHWHVFHVIARKKE